VRVIHGADAQRARSDGVVGQPGEMDVLQLTGEVVLRPVALNACQQAIRAKDVAVVAATWRRLDPPPEQNCASQLG